MAESGENAKDSEELDDIGAAQKAERLRSKIQIAGERQRRQLRALHCNAIGGPRQQHHHHYRRDLHHAQ